MDRGTANGTIELDVHGPLSDQFCLSLCLHDCLSEAEFHSVVAGFHLRQAIEALAGDVQTAANDDAGTITTARALAAYLDFLLPELSQRSPRAARSVRSAVRSLRAPARPLWVSFH